ncbi:YaiO family outer membrane beta-barrel protein [Maribacter algarum]|uniref:YaiO family outer membrane beta-barrel protein n=1 Tax=Maribacter algarum (ex Zhang et al. 2020) TaxID=2578118 RepID=A0A5S3PRJ5_9FLAO|nr:YaiO family outer membrane beta-barrel protein [Maribacter algarum]TMM57367.1 YaiO family outer membrane beta-barrel protein [Maribacter algarum]
MSLKKLHSVLFFGLLCFIGRSQDIAYHDVNDTPYTKAHKLAYEGKHKNAKDILVQLVAKNSEDLDARTLLASTYSWNGQYTKARDEFNKVTSVERTNSAVWISSIKNELYANQNPTALGLANKALFYLKSNTEVERLRKMAIERIQNKKYPELGWHNTKSPLKTKVSKKKAKKKNTPEEKEVKPEIKDTKPENANEAKTPVAKEVLNNRIAIRNAFTVFDQRYDPAIYSSVSLRRQTQAGSLIPRINYNNRNGQHGVQYDLDFYPKFSKRFYAYLNYGYSNATIFPKHKFGGDLYVNLPGAMEFSAGARYISFASRNVTVYANSIGHYRGNYYFSLRSYVRPKENDLIGISGNLLVRKYLKDAENFFGINVGMGYSPELRQLISGDELLAETLLYVESQRLSLEYQFTGKSNTNSYRANMGVTRQEFAFAAGEYFFGVSAGLTYQVKF